MSSIEFPKARSKDLVILARAGETLVYDMVSNEAHCLNETASFIWNQCSGEASVDDISRSVEKQFGRRAGEIVSFGIRQLNQRNLLSSGGLTAQMPSRREAIKRMGLASAVAVPMILSIVAPANALGSLSCRTACTNPGQCLQLPQCGNSCSPLGECAPPTV